MSDTPRTDANQWEPFDNNAVVYADFARVLECELSACRKDIARLRLACEEALEFAENYEDVRDGSDGRPQPNKAMSVCTVLRDALEKIK